MSGQTPVVLLRNVIEKRLPLGQMSVKRLSGTELVYPHGDKDYVVW
jgi:hypothetical protein